MFLDSRDVGFAPHIIMDGFWEYWITQFIAARMKDGAVVLDVGANFGYYTLLMSDLIGPSGKCIAFEPNPGVAAKLRKTIAINGFESRATIHEVALGSESNGETAFLIPRGEPKNARVLNDQGRRTDATGHVITVQRANADTICADLQRLDFVKIDAEGAEANIIDGMTVLIARFKPDILLEFNAGREYDSRALVSRLSDVYGPPSYVDYDGQLQPVTLDQLETESVGEDWMLYFSR
jgi:FkbM family methyltransferase